MKHVIISWWTIARHIKTFQLGFFADDTPKDVILKLGTNGCVQKYGVDLNMDLSKGAQKWKYTESRIAPSFS